MIMKAIYKLATLILCTLSLCTFTACKQDLTFDHEKMQFEPMQNAILIELVAPVGTSVDDEIYIFGPFNGLTENTAVGEIAWQMEKASASDKKWGIYLFPKDFIEGKTLADGFAFVSKKAGGERDIRGQVVTHTLNATTGTGYNIWADRWAAYFNTDNTVQHNGPVVYVLDESGFAKLNLYMYGDMNDLNGGWPGMNPTGTENVNGLELTYFDMGDGNEGLSETLIFSDNGANQLADYGPITLGSEPVYLHITADGKVETLNIDGIVGHDGPVVYVLDGKEWGMNTTLYMWGDVNDLNGGWPGMTANGTETFGDYTYLYFDLGETNIGLKESLIFSNNGATQLGDFPGNNNLWTIEEDLYLYIGPDGVVQISDPEQPGDVTWFDPQARPKEQASIDLYLYNGTDTLAVIPDIAGNDSIVPFYLYTWGSNEAFGAWPGTASANLDSISILGLPLLHTRITGFVGDIYHLIINNNRGTQLDDYTVEAIEPQNEYYLKLSDSGITLLSVAAQAGKK